MDTYTHLINAGQIKDNNKGKLVIHDKGIPFVLGKIPVITFDYTCDVEGITIIATIDGTTYSGNLNGDNADFNECEFYNDFNSAEQSMIHNQAKKYIAGLYREMNN